jgi:predicted Zn-dependent protease
MKAMTWEVVFNEACTQALSLVTNSLALNMNFSAEDSEFIRFNKSKVRQISSVEQATLDLELHQGSKRASFAINLSRDLDQNRTLIQATLTKLKNEVSQLPDDPFISPLQNMGTSRTVSQGSLPSTDEFLDFIGQTLAQNDLAGIFIKGETHRANANSLGQKHWFSSQSFVFDYSLYSAKERAIKGSYGGSHFNPMDLRASLNDSLSALKVMDLEKIVLKPNKYRVYLAPAAVKEIVDMLRWHALSMGAYKRGDSPFTDLIENRKKLSPLFTLTEDYSLGLSPKFNERGEVFADRLPIIEKGELKNLFTSTSSEKEFDTKSNFAGEDEAHKSAIIATGTLAREQILKELGTGLYLSNLHYLNWSDKTKGRITGMTRFGCLWVEDGKIVGPIKDLRFDDTLYHLFGESVLNLTNFADTSVENMTYSERHIGGSKTPGILLSEINFTL